MKAPPLDKNPAAQRHMKLCTEAPAAHVVTLPLRHTVPSSHATHTPPSMRMPGVHTQSASSVEPAAAEELAGHETNSSPKQKLLMSHKTQCSDAL